MNAGLVSIMMPAYNAEKYIKKAIDSVIAQRYSNWELIIVNDGSKDKTVEIVKKHLSDTRIKLIHQENGGEASARNTALSQMQGEFISFLDADDLYLPNALMDRVNFLNSHAQYDAVVSDGSYLTDYDQNLGYLSDIRPRKDCSGNILEVLVLNPGVVGPPIGIMVRRTCVEKLSLRFDTKVGYGTDWDFWTHLARYIQFGYLDKLTHRYRIHDTNMTRSNGRQKIINDWIYGRMKVFNSDWFEELSLPTRQIFIYNLLINYLSDQPNKQEAILNSNQFLCLPVTTQAQLLRNMGVIYLVKRSNQTFAVQCIQRAFDLVPNDKKNRFLLWIINLGELPTMAFLHLWQFIHHAKKHLRNRGHHQPKPVPSQLRVIEFQ